MCWMSYCAKCEANTMRLNRFGNIVTLSTLWGQLLALVARKSSLCTERVQRHRVPAGSALNPQIPPKGAPTEDLVVAHACWQSQIRILRVARARYVALTFPLLTLSGWCTSPHSRIAEALVSRLALLCYSYRTPSSFSERRNFYARNEHRLIVPLFSWQSCRD